jgi:FKBP-type peptidyl-prolyl cis-trans isomerase 2
MSGKTEDMYSPFSVMIGGNQVIPGFENGLKGLKVREKKVIEVPPELGTGPVMTTIPKYNIAPVFTMTQDKALFADTITETVPRTELPEDMKSAVV